MDVYAYQSALAVQGRLVTVTEAVHSPVGRAESATVNAVAEELGIDQSAASRMLTEAVEAGCLTLARGPRDGRRRTASVTAAGDTQLEQAHAWQEEVFIELTSGWSARRRNDFHQAMADLLARSYEPRPTSLAGMVS